MPSRMSLRDVHLCCWKTFIWRYELAYSSQFLVWSSIVPGNDTHMHHAVIENILDCWYRVWIFYGIISTESVDLFKFYVSLNDIWQCQVKSKNKFLMLFHLFVQVKLVSSTNKSTLMVKWRKIRFNTLFFRCFYFWLFFLRPRSF